MNPFKASKHQNSGLSSMTSTLSCLGNQVKGVAKTTFHRHAMLSPWVRVESAEQGEAYGIIFDTKTKVSVLDVMSSCTRPGELLPEAKWRSVQRGFGERWVRQRDIQPGSVGWSQRKKWNQPH